jgi:hypothetical protein
MGEYNTIIFGRKEETVFSFLVEKKTWAKRGRSFLGEKSSAQQTESATDIGVDLSESFHKHL